MGRAPVPGGADLSFRSHGARDAALRVLGEELSPEQRDACVILQSRGAHLGAAVHRTAVPGNLKLEADGTSVL